MSTTATFALIAALWLALSAAAAFAFGWVVAETRRRDAEWDLWERQQTARRLDAVADSDTGRRFT